MDDLPDSIIGEASGGHPGELSQEHKVANVSADAMDDLPDSIVGEASGAHPGELPQEQQVVNVSMYERRLARAKKASEPQPEPKPPSAYDKRVARAKAAAKMEAAASDGVTRLALDLTALPAASPVEGDHKLGDGEAAETITTPRAKDDGAITVRGEPKHRHSQIFRIGPDVLGYGRFRFAWRPGGGMIATASSKDDKMIVSLFMRDGSLYNRHVMGAGKCSWLGWECKGTCVAVMQVGAGLFLWEVPLPE